LTSQIRRNSQEIERQPFTGKKGKKPSGEKQRRIPLRDGQKQETSCGQKESVHVYDINTFNKHEVTADKC